MKWQRKILWRGKANLTMKNYRSSMPNKFPEFSLSFCRVFKIPWVVTKFPEISLIFQKKCFSLSFPGPWEPCSSNGAKPLSEPVYAGLLLIGLVRWNFDAFENIICKMDAILSWRWCVKSIISAATHCLCPSHFRVWLTGNSPEVTSFCYGFPGCSPNSTAVNWIIEVCLRSNNLRWIWCFCLGCIYLSQFIVLFLCHAILWIFHWDVQCRSGGPDDLVIWICSAAGCPGTPLHRAWQVVGFDECTACGLPFITDSPPGICAVHLYVLYIISRILDKAVM